MDVFHYVTLFLKTKTKPQCFLDISWWLLPTHSSNLFPFSMPQKAEFHWTISTGLLCLLVGMPKGSLAGDEREKGEQGLSIFNLPYKVSSDKVHWTEGHGFPGGPWPQFPGIAPYLQLPFTTLPLHPQIFFTKPHCKYPVHVGLQLCQLWQLLAGNCKQVPWRQHSVLQRALGSDSLWVQFCDIQVYNRVNIV